MRLSNQVRRRMLEAAIHDLFVHAIAHADNQTGLQVISDMIENLSEYNVLPDRLMNSIVYELTGIDPCAYQSEDRV